MSSLAEFLETASKAYYDGEPIISDEQFDALIYSLTGIGAKPSGKTMKHKFQMYSLQKYYVGEGKCPLEGYTQRKIDTPKIDGAAISLLYNYGCLVAAATRGDGTEGTIITDKFVNNRLSPVPDRIDTMQEWLQVTGEMAVFSTTPNARNVAAGALSLNSVDEFNTREVKFIAYGVSPSIREFYDRDMQFLEEAGFKTVLNETWCSNFPQDGRVIRINSRADYESQGYTSIFPRGAYAMKERKVGKLTILRDVVWQTGKSGRVSPVAILDPVELGGATVTRATLNNPGFIKALALEIGDTVEIVRAGEIIPCVVRKVSAEELSK